METVITISAILQLVIILWLAGAILINAVQHKAEPLVVMISTVVMSTLVITTFINFYAIFAA